MLANRLLSFLLPILVKMGLKQGFRSGCMFFLRNSRLPAVFQSLLRIEIATMNLREWLMQKKMSNSVLKWLNSAVAQLGTVRPLGLQVGVGHSNPERGNFLKFRYLMAFDGIFTLKKKYWRQIPYLRRKTTIIMRFWFPTYREFIQPLRVHSFQASEGEQTLEVGRHELFTIYSRPGFCQVGFGNRHVGDG